MRRLITFAMGMIFGGLLLWSALHYHLLYTKTGLRLIPKVNSTLAKTYVDIRGFTVADWARNTDLALALANSDQEELIENSTRDALQNGIDRWLDSSEQ